MSYKVEPFLHPSSIEKKTDNIVQTMLSPVLEKKSVLNVTEKHEGAGNGYYIILKYKNEYRMYYRAIAHDVWKNENKTEWFSTEELAPHECVCLATSTDGLNFVKGNYANSSNNIIKKDSSCHNFFPFYSDRDKKFYGLAGTNIFNKGLYLFISEDGYKWTHRKIVDPKDILKGWRHHNHFDTLNCMIYNENEDLFYLYLRHNDPNIRLIQYTTTKDLKTLSPFKLLNIKDEGKTNYYTPGIHNYPNSDYYIALPTIAVDWNIKKNCSKLMVSNNGKDWLFVNNNFFNSSNKMDVNGVVSSVDNKKLYFYTHENAKDRDNRIDCYSIGKDRLQKLYCTENGEIIVKKKLISNKLKINFETYDNGFIQVFIKCNCSSILCISKKLIGNQTEHEIEWHIEKNIEEIMECNIIFILNNASLFSFYYEV